MRNIILNTRNDAMKIHNGAHGAELKESSAELVQFYLETASQMNRMQQILNGIPDSELTDGEKKILAILNS